MNGRPRLNEKLLRDTLRYIEENPEEWDQSQWRHETSCGTMMCFAGHACDLNGAQWEGNSDYIIENRRFPWIGRFSGSTNGARSAATKALGLTHCEAETLFCGGNQKEDLRLMVDWVIDRRRQNSSENVVEYAERVGSERAETLRSRGVMAINGEMITQQIPSYPPPPSIYQEYSMFGGTMYIDGNPIAEIRPVETQPVLDETDQAFYKAIYDTTPDKERTEGSEDTEIQEELPVVIVRP